MHDDQRLLHWAPPVGAILLATLGALVAATSAAAQTIPRPPGPEGSPRAAYLEPSMAGVDFAYQGEYCGDRSQPSACRGFQVVAGGDGQFVAVAYVGGLPGAGWNQSAVTRYHGSRDERQPTLELTGDDGSRALVAPDAIELVDASGATVAVARRVARGSPTLGAPPPPGALKLGLDTPWLLSDARAEQGLLASGFATTFDVGDFHLHVEFRAPFMPRARGQQRGNSGVYIQRRYEVQILDSFGLAGEANECGGLYRQQAPAINMCFPPLSWQTYDIAFRSPRWDRAAVNDHPLKLENARLTVWHNGYPVHENREIPGKTGAGKAETPELETILFQDHQDPVRFRNLWIAFPTPAEWSPAEWSPPSTGPAWPWPGCGVATGATTWFDR